MHCSLNHSKFAHIECDDYAFDQRIAGFCANFPNYTVPITSLLRNSIGTAHVDSLDMGARAAGS